MVSRLTLRLAVAASLLGVSVLTASVASATTFQFIYTGAFSSADALSPVGGSTSYFADGTPFTFDAIFDDTTPNIAAPIGIPGFVSYSPSSAVLTVNGTKYNVATYDQDPVSGVTVTIFDQNTPFGPGHYAAGFLQSPLEDGSGVIGDWANASPNFLATNLVPTVFSDYFGAGFSPGPEDGVEIRPIPVTDFNGNAYLLGLGFRDEEYVDGAPLNTAQLIAVPEPGAVAFALTTVVMTGALVVRRRRK